MFIPVFFVLHWYLSLFMHSFFLHRYSAHQMFKLSKFWERFFYLLTYLLQGASFLNPRAYAILHRMHHEYSDTEKDPHSPMQHSSVFGMMWHTRNVYLRVNERRVEVEPQFEGGYPIWRSFDRIAESWYSRVFWIAAYTSIYYVFVEHWWMYALLPIHFIMGPAQGAIVNWCGHKYGYQNFDNHDHSKNTLAIDFLMLGELFQNNHHKFPNRPNFGSRWFEFDPTYFFMKIFDRLGFAKLKARRIPVADVVERQRSGNIG